MSQIRRSFRAFGPFRLSTPTRPRDRGWDTKIRAAANLLEVFYVDQGAGPRAFVRFSMWRDGPLPAVPTEPPHADLTVFNRAQLPAILNALVTQDSDVSFWIHGPDLNGETSAGPALRVLDLVALDQFAPATDDTQTDLLAARVPLRSHFLFKGQKRGSSISFGGAGGTCDMRFDLGVPLPFGTGLANAVMAFGGVFATAGAKAQDMLKPHTVLAGAPGRPAMATFGADMFASVHASLLPDCQTALPLSDVVSYPQADQRAFPCTVGASGDATGALSDILCTASGGQTPAFRVRMRSDMAEITAACTLSDDTLSAALCAAHDDRPKDTLGWRFEAKPAAPFADETAPKWTLNGVLGGALTVERAKASALIPSEGKHRPVAPPKQGHNAGPTPGLHLSVRARSARLRIWRLGATALRTVAPSVFALGPNARALGPVAANQNRAVPETATPGIIGDIAAHNALISLHQSLLDEKDGDSDMLMKDFLSRPALGSLGGCLPAVPVGAEHAQLYRPSRQDPALDRLAPLSMLALEWAQPTLEQTPLPAADPATAALDPKRLQTALAAFGAALTRLELAFDFKAVSDALECELKSSDFARRLKTADVDTCHTQPPAATARLGTGVTLTHDPDPQPGRALARIDVALDLTGRKKMFSLGPYEIYAMRTRLDVWQRADVCTLSPNAAARIADRARLTTDLEVIVDGQHVATLRDVEVFGTGGAALDLRIDLGTTEIHAGCRDAVDELSATLSMPHLPEAAPDIASLRGLVAKQLQRAFGTTAPDPADVALSVVHSSEVDAARWHSLRSVAGVTYRLQDAPSDLSKTTKTGALRRKSF